MWMLKAPPLIPRIHISWYSNIDLTEEHKICSKKCLKSSNIGKKVENGICPIKKVDKFRTDIVIIGPTNYILLLRNVVPRNKRGVLLATAFSNVKIKQASKSKVTKSS